MYIPLEVGNSKSDRIVRSRVWSGVEDAKVVSA